jgi:CMP/dCMP kinase
VISAPTYTCLPNVSVDGPAGAGKTTVARMFAREVRFRHIDSGAMYRAVTLRALEDGWNGRDEDDEMLVSLARNLDVQFGSDDAGEGLVLLGGIDRTEDLRCRAVEESVSFVARSPEVRLALMYRQRELARDGGVVMDGRDIGSFVLTGAELKVYLTAALPVRIARRLLQRRCSGIRITWEEAARSVVNRDRIDSTRSVAPLRPAADAVIIDSTHLTRSDVVRQMKFMLSDRMKDRGGG